MDPIVSQAHGAGDGEASALALQRGLIVAVAVSLPLAALWIATGPMLVFFGQDPEVAELAQAYMLARLPSALGFNLFIALRQYLAGRALTRPAMWVMFLCNGVNVFLNWVLIFGHLGVPPLGLVGAGLATGLTNVLLPLVLWAWILWFRLHEGAWRRWDVRSFAASGLRRHLALGLPVGIQLTLEGNAFMVAMIMVGWLGVIELAAHQVVINMASFTFMVPLGIAIGASARAGNLIGARRPEQLRLACRVGFAMGGGVMALAALAFVTLRQQLPTLYVSDPPVVALAAVQRVCSDPATRRSLNAPGSAVAASTTSRSSSGNRTSSPAAAAARSTRVSPASDSDDRRKPCSAVLMGSVSSPSYSGASTIWRIWGRTCAGSRSSARLPRSSNRSAPPRPSSRANRSAGTDQRRARSRSGPRAIARRRDAGARWNQRAIRSARPSPSSMRPPNSSSPPSPASAIRTSARARTDSARSRVPPPSASGCPRDRAIASKALAISALPTVTWWCSIPSSCATRPAKGASG